MTKPEGRNKCVCRGLSDSGGDRTVGDVLPNISDSEMDVLKLLWEHGPATVRELHARLRRRRRRGAYNTVLTRVPELELAIQKLR
ncbi:MAG TPA: BlaI/MecI/CopY family transcriptional regulator [Planctomycetaceae bacterium]|nr:BlaI/MecI/CopY family transcriptional regulator [Planctomycetaceae bacterium]